MISPGQGGAGPIQRLEASALPACLGDLSRPVAGLWLMGDLSALVGAPARHVAIVGTREASPYGIRVAERLAAACARAGLVVVSGLARGVDAAAHRAALAAGGATVGVQGTGVDVPYPASHRALHQAMVRQGTVVSELEPGTVAGPGCFPRRNRIIAALCQVTVVVEAGFKSGAINTATQALELGRVVAAVPGRIDEERSMGGNQLLRDGAQVICGVDDLLSLMGISTELASRRNPTAGARTATALPQFGGMDRGVEAVDGRAAPESAPVAGDTDTNMSFRRLAEELLGAEFSGEVERDGLGYRPRLS